MSSVSDEDRMFLMDKLSRIHTSKNNMEETYTMILNVASKQDYYGRPNFTAFIASLRQCPSVCMALRYMIIEYHQNEKKERENRWNRRREIILGFTHGRSTENAENKNIIEIMLNLSMIPSDPIVRTIVQFI